MPSLLYNLRAVPRLDWSSGVAGCLAAMKKKLRAPPMVQAFSQRQMAVMSDYKWNWCIFVFGGMKRRKETVEIQVEEAYILHV
jgi:hypothetical protein